MTVQLPRFNPRSDRRQKQVKHLVACGERCVLEALIAVDSGQPLDAVLEDYARIPSCFFSILGASSFARVLHIITRSSK